MASTTHESSTEVVIDHVETYRSFIKLMTAGSFLCAFVLVALITFWFAGTWSWFSGFAVLFLGLAGVGFDLATQRQWVASSSLLVLCILLTAFNISG